ncbi:hypothetical protein FJ364_02800 [Candidatus Dependentiae bacterium]|nr:hypothetical protein [Candidatus Dependentiae bacterium]
MKIKEFIRKIGQQVKAFFTRSNVPMFQLEVIPGVCGKHATVVNTKTGVLYYGSINTDLPLSEDLNCKISSLCNKHTTAAKQEVVLSAEKKNVVAQENVMVNAVEQEVVQCLEEKPVPGRKKARKQPKNDTKISTKKASNTQVKRVAAAPKKTEKVVVVAPQPVVAEELKVVQQPVVAEVESIATNAQPVVKKAGRKRKTTVKAVAQPIVEVANKEAEQVTAPKIKPVSKNKKTQKQLAETIDPVIA